MKMYKENFGFNNFNKTKLLVMFSVYIFIFVVFLSVGFSAFQEELIMDDISARINLKTDVRVTGFKVVSTTNNAVPSNTDYNYNRIYGDIILPEGSSSVMYQMEITNIGNTKVGISNISGISENLKYTLIDYQIGQSISEDGKYTSGIKQTILIKIEYVNGVVTDEIQNFNLEIEFKTFHSITYHGVPGEDNFPTEIIDGSDLVITSEMTSIDRLKVTQDTVFLTYNEHFFYDEEQNKLTVKNVTGDLLLSYRDTTYLVNLASNTAYFKESTYREYITSIDFVNYIDISEAEKTYDLSTNGDQSIIGWVKKYDDDGDGEPDTDSSGNTLYKLYVGSIYDIYSKNMESAFAYMYGLRSINFENLDTSESISFNYTFYKTEIADLDLSTFNTSSALVMQNMFGGMKNLKALDVSNFNTSQVTNMWYMFGGLTNITELDISTFNTSKVTNMGYMFSGMEKLKVLNLGENFNTANVTIMDCMFNKLESIENLDVSTFNTTSLLSAKNMFYNCKKLTTLDLTSFNVANVTNMYYMFGNMNSLNTLIIDNFNTSNVTTMEGMFANCSSLANLDLSHFNTQKLTNMNQMFSNMYKLESINLSSFDTSKVTDMQKLFVQCIRLKEINLANASFTTVKSYADMFNALPTDVVITVKDNDAKDWIQDRLGEGQGTIVVLADKETDNDNENNTTETE